MRAFILVTLIVLLASVGLMMQVGGAIDVDVGVLLESNDIATLDAVFADWQSKFEHGQLDEFQMRAGYRNFYSLDAVAAANLTAWAASEPQSYAAHTALGIYYKEIAMTWRGGRSAANVPNARMVTAMAYFAKAAAELQKSMSLTAKPYMSVFHLLSVAQYTGDREAAAALLAKGNAVLPDNTLVRARYAVTLTPRWGGSYDALDAFIDATRRAGGGEKLIAELQAIEEDSKGHDAQDRGDAAAAIAAHYTRALELGDSAGGTVTADFLGVSSLYACRTLDETKYCGCPTCGRSSSSYDE